MKKIFLFVLSILLMTVSSSAVYAVGTSASGYTDVDTIDASLTGDIVAGQDGKFSLNWAKYTGSSLEYYKVLHSQDKVNMTYPEDSYVYFSADANDTSYVADLSDGVNYFRVCVLTTDMLRACGNTVTVNYSAPVADPTLISSTYDSNLSAVLNGDVVTLVWDKYVGDGFSGYKVVHSSTNALPVYPDDGYLTYITDSAKTDFLTNTVDQGDNYYRVCALVNADVVCGNVVMLVSDVSGNGSDLSSDIYTDDSNINMSLTAVLDADKVRLSWNEYTGGNLKWYKVVHSTSNSGLYYPNDGYIEVFTNSGNVGYTHTTPSYGVNYYRVCVITTDNRRGCSNVEEINFVGGVVPFVSYFADMQTHWAKDFVNKLAFDGVVKGMNGNFMPDDNVIRVDALKMIMYAFDMEGTTCDAGLFPDMSEGDWYCNVVTLAYGKNIIKGDSGKLMPVRTLTRAEAVKILIEVTGEDLPLMYNSIFADVSEDDWFASYVELSKRQGYVMGYDVDGSKEFRPFQPITRGELAKIISIAREKNL